MPEAAPAVPPGKDALSGVRSGTQLVKQQLPLLLQPQVRLMG